MDEGVWRDERRCPERRRQVVRADTGVAAARLAGAFASLGLVRAGRWRVKVVSIGHRARAVVQSGVTVAVGQEGRA